MIRPVFAMCALVLAGCGAGDLPVNPQANEALPGGDTTFTKLNPSVSLSQHAYSRPASNLSSEERALFTVGNSFFTAPWVSAPSTVASRDGLGPLFNAAACQDCHIRDGRGRPPGPDDSSASSIVRLATAEGYPDPVYGGQIQDRALPGLEPEARVEVQWLYSSETLAGGERVELRQPQVHLNNLAYGDVSAPHWGLRVAPPVIGLGLLELIPVEDILLNEDSLDSDSDGISGRAQRLAVLADGTTLLGRFGWKAAQPTVRSQSLTAFASDMGISSAALPGSLCTQSQALCLEFPDGGRPELASAIEEAVVFYTRHLAVPGRRGLKSEQISQGKKLFVDIGCASCHRPSWKTGVDTSSPALSGQYIWPYTDLLLHDMGEGLADHIREGVANGREWRTAPLWGLHLAKVVGGQGVGFLHDGRARNFKEAILWHGGEAKSAKQRWAALPQEERERLIAFLDSL